MVGPARPVFVLFGSSIVQFSFGNGGWGAILANIYSRKADILVRGYAGWNSRCAVQVLNQVFPLDSALQPSLVIVYFGGNDAVGYVNDKDGSIGPHPSGLGPHVPLDEYIENMRTIATHLKKLPKEPHIIFLTCPPVDEKMLQLRRGDTCQMVRTNERCEQYAKACVDLCMDMNVKVVNLYNAITQQKDWSTTCFTDDGIHLTHEGSKIVVKEILKVIREADWEPSLHWRSLPTEFGQDLPYYSVAADERSTINPSDHTTHWEIQPDEI
ncbi:GDSL esterase/lipase CPRD49 [Canna indica]|uniref:GDSL esterase/lipase CPRD49 n=1 Tax=Canna indica TaxID=4628 RepID=A0AAQ3L1Q6_9LILI|nr:GDSL esterase/lipase CPRD49 [Canna indica]